MVNVIKSKVFPEDGLSVELYVMNDGRHAVRMFDMDAQEVVGITIYPTPERADAAYEAVLTRV